jgi:hypothetical protein
MRGMNSKGVSGMQSSYRRVWQSIQKGSPPSLPSFSTLAQALIAEARLGEWSMPKIGTQQKSKS